MQSKANISEIQRCITFYALRTDHIICDDGGPESTIYGCRILLPSYYSPFRYRLP